MTAEMNLMSIPIALILLVPLMSLLARITDAFIKPGCAMAVMTVLMDLMKSVVTKNPARTGSGPAQNLENVFIFPRCVMEPTIVMMVEMKVPPVVFLIALGYPVAMIARERHPVENVTVL